ncbi:MAG: TMEM175 family protein [Patescibacteria group bacterium]
MHIMKQARLDQLADGIFAIVMTLLAIEIHVPFLTGTITNGTLLQSLFSLTPLFLSYALSFLLLFTYWRGHHYIASVLAQSIDNRLTTINAFFFLSVGLIPFSTLLLGRYFFTQTAIVAYGINIIVTGLLLYWMRQYILSAPTIVNQELTPTLLQHGTIRILFPVAAAIVAIVLSFVSIQLSLVLFTLCILFNLSSRSTTLFLRFFPNSFLRNL